MITIFDVIQFALPILGISFGYSFGKQFGFWIGIAFAIIGLVIGYVLGKLPFILTISSLKNNLEKKSSADLRKEFMQDDCLIPNVILLELSSREEDISNEFIILLKKLESNESDKRSRAWNALQSAFPNMANMILDYHFSDSPEVCKRKVRKLRDFLTKDKLHKSQPK